MNIKQLLMTNDARVEHNATNNELCSSRELRR